MLRTISSKHVFKVLGFAILVVALIDLPSWIVEQQLVTGEMSISIGLTIQAVLAAAIAVGLYRFLRSEFQSARMSNGGLSEREVEVMNSILQGMTNKEIQESLFIEKSTLKSHINRIYRKLEVSNRQELILKYSKG